MKHRIPQLLEKWGLLAAVILAAGIGWGTRSGWLPSATGWVQRTFRPAGESADGHAEGEADSHAGHDHGAHAGHDEATSLELSDQARGNRSEERRVGKECRSRWSP